MKGKSFAFINVRCRVINLYYWFIVNCFRNLQFMFNKTLSYRPRMSPDFSMHSNISGVFFSFLIANNSKELLIKDGCCKSSGRAAVPETVAPFHHIQTSSLFDVNDHDWLRVWKAQPITSLHVTFGGKKIEVRGLFPCATMTEHGE